MVAPRPSSSFLHGGLLDEPGFALDIPLSLRVVSLES
jgi:hypothetical protein